MSDWCGAGSPWCGTALAWTNTNSPWCGAGSPWDNINSPWCGVGPAWTNTNSPWCGVGVPWDNTNSPWCGVGSSWYGVGIPFGCNWPDAASAACVTPLQEFWFTSGNFPITVQQGTSAPFVVNSLGEHFSLDCGTEWCLIVPAIAIDSCAILYLLHPVGTVLPGIISCIGTCDETVKSSTKQYTYTPCYCHDETLPVWTVAGVGASISQSGLLTTTAAACGILTITVTQEGCITVSQAVRVTNGGSWCLIQAEYIRTTESCNCHPVAGCSGCSGNCGGSPCCYYTTWSQTIGKYYVQCSTHFQKFRDGCCGPGCSPPPMMTIFPTCSSNWGCYDGSYSAPQITFGWYELYEWKCIC